MALNIGKARSMIELMAQGVDKVYSQNPQLVRDLIDLKLREFCDRTGVLETKASLTSVSGTSEYELPVDALHIKEVHFDDYRANKITHDQVIELKGQV